MICYIKALMLFFIYWVSSANAHVDLIYPMGGEIFQTGSDITIQWQEIAYHGDGDWDLYFSEDNGVTWQTIQDNINQASLSYNWQLPHLATGQAKIRVIQDNENARDYESISGSFTIGATTDISDPDDHKQKGFVLNPAYPNPFNGSATISFSLAQFSHVEINIYNILGKRVDKLLDGQISEGAHRFRWSPENLQSGIYYYTIQSGLIVETKRLIYIK